MQDLRAHIQSISRRNLLIFTALASFVLGILVASFVPIPPLVSILIIAVAFAIYYAERHTLILVVMIAFALGAFRYAIKDFHEPRAPGNTGIVVTEPDQRDSDTRFVVETNTGEKVLVTTGIVSEVKYGDEVALSGNAKPLAPGGYGNFLAKDDVYFTLDGRVSIISSGHGHPIKSALLKIKSAFVERVRRILPEPESSLLAGLIVSGKQALPDETLEAFRRAGVVHIVVLSGYNITIIAEFLLLIFGFWGSRRAAGVSALGVIFFTIMAGAPATVVRGAIMVLLLLVGKLIHRPGSAPRILLFTAFLMLLHNPKILVFDPSFQLSFLALIGLIFLTPIIQSYAEKLFASHGREGNSRQIAPRLRELVYATLATQILVFPFLLYNMGNFSLVFLLANLLILPILPIVMLVGFVAALIAFVSGVLAWPLSFIAHILLSWILLVANFLGNLSFAAIETENFPLWGSLLLYIVIGFILWRFRSSAPPLPNLG